MSYNPFATPPASPSLARAATNPFVDEDQTQKYSSLAHATIEVGPASVIPDVNQDIRNPTPRPSFSSWNPFEEEPAEATTASQQPQLTTIGDLENSVRKILPLIELHFNTFQTTPNSTTGKQLKEAIAAQYFIVYGFTEQAMQNAICIEALIDQLVMKAKNQPKEINEAMIQTAFQQAQRLQEMLYSRERQVESRDGVTLDRYGEIYSNPTAQVNLTGEGYINGGYINASHIRMENLELKLRYVEVDEDLLLKIDWPQLQQHNYIATQGPLPQTIADFWHIVAQYHATNIVMLTHLEEKGKNKCTQYWAGEASRIYNPENAEQIVNHHWFKDWPDHGIPELKEPFLALLRTVAAQGTSGAPIIVHCSAGVGRTGTFILVDMMQRIIGALKHNESLTALDKLNLATGVLKYLRTCRTWMVQTEEQWRFALDCIGATPAAHLTVESEI